MKDIIKNVIDGMEAKKLEIPIFGLVDTNCDPDGIDYPIPGNDDSYKSIEIITRLISDAILSVSVKEPEPVENPEAV